MRQLLGDDQLLSNVEAGPIEHQLEAFSGTQPDVPPEEDQGLTDVLDVDRREEAPGGLTGVRLAAGIDAESRITGQDQGDGSLANRSSEPTEDRMHEEAVLVERPDFSLEVAEELAGVT